MPETEAPHSERGVEKESTRTPSPEFSRRVLAASSNIDAANPNRPYSLPSREALGTFINRDYTLYNTRSDDERVAHWRESKITEFDAQKNAWTDSTIKAVNVLAAHL